MELKKGSFREKNRRDKYPLMLKNWGRLLWRQSREISVMNYPNHLVYEIYTNQGYFYVAHDKRKDTFVVMDAHKLELTKPELDTYATNRTQTLFLPPLQ